MKKRFAWYVSSLLVLALLLAACGGGAAEETPGATMPAATEAMTEEPMATEEMTEEPMATEEMTEEPMATEEMTEEPMATEEMTEEPTAEATEAATPGAVSGEIDCAGAASGDEVTMYYQWTGAEEEALNAILKPLVDACGITITAEASRDQALLDTRIQAGTPPDIAFFNVVQLNQYSDLLVPVTDLGVNDANYPEFWREIGSVGGEWLGLPVKADIKSIIWYNPANFEALGYTVPTTWEELEALVEQIVADGYVPWSMGMESSGGSTGWTGSDFIQDILLVQQGPEYVMGIIDGSVPYNDEGVAQAYETYGMWAKDEAYTVGGAQGTLNTNFRDAIFDIVVDPPAALMVKQSGFAGGEIATDYPDLEYGVDYDFFPVPGLQGLQGGSDWMMAFSDEPAVAAIFTYLSSELGAQNWAAQNFGLTTNQAGFATYDPESANGKMAAILETAEGFTPDIGDTIPGGFGSAEWKAIVDFVNGADLAGALEEAAAVQAEAVPAP